MDQLFHFQGNSNVQKLKSSTNQQYYSDVEPEDSTQKRPETTVKKNSIATNPFKVDSGYATDETSDRENLSMKATSKNFNGKTSKFKNLSTKQPDGDEGLNHDEEQSHQNQDPRNNKIKKQGSSNENSQTLSYISYKIGISSQKVLKNRLINETRQADSDADAKKITAKNQIVDELKNHSYRHLIFSNYIIESTFKKHLSLVYRGLIYAHKCLKGPSDAYIKSKQVKIQRPKGKIPFEIFKQLIQNIDIVSKGKTLFLDLDETLIHSCALKESPDHIIKAQNEKGEVQQIGLRIRPFCLEFLQKMTQFWDIYIFTASSSAYAEAIINFIDPQRKYVSGILNRSNCMETKNGFFIKDLRIVTDSDLKYTILVDNLAHSFGFQPDNGVPILEWHNDKQDQELKYLMNYLIQAVQSPDVREFNKQTLKLDKLIQCTQAELGI